jgi:hypothetical protein
MNDILRIVFYTGLLFLALLSPIARPHIGDSPLQAPELYAYTLPEFFTLEGFMKVVGKGWITLKTLKLIRAICLIGWIGCILGFGGIWCPLLVGICMLILHGIVVGCVGTNHRWYAPVYTTLALTFSNGNRLYSIDHYLSSHYAKYPFRTLTESSLLTSGFGRKVALVGCLLTLFFGGITKLLNSGILWMNGTTIAYYVSDESKGRWPWLKRLVSKSQYFSMFLSIQSMILELLSPWALFAELARSILIVMATIFHLGIFLTLNPDYFPQTWCYLLGLDFNNSEKSQTTVNTTTLTAAWGITGLLIFLTVFCFLLRIDYWPLSNIAMYSFYRDNSYSHKYLKDVDQAKRVSQQCANFNFNPIGWSSKWICLRIVDSIDNMIDIEESIVQKGNKQGVLLKQWTRIKNGIAARDIMAKLKDTQLEYSFRVNSKNYPAQVWLLKNVNAWRSRYRSLPVWTTQNNTKLQLVVRLKNDRSFVLASTSWVIDETEK